MTDPTVLAIVAIVPPTLLALTGLVVALTNATHLMRVDDELQRHSNALPAAIVVGPKGVTDAEPTAGRV
jgi:hypothetical protein